MNGLYYNRAARVVPAVISLPAKCARAEAMSIYQDPVICLILGFLVHELFTKSATFYITYPPGGAA